MKNIICTLYYNSDVNSQNLIKNVEDNFEYIKMWYNSIIKFNLNGIIFYDNLSDSFLSKYSNENVKFINFDMKKYKNLLKYDSIGFNDGRFLLYNEYINILDVTDIWFTDCSDVIIKNNPFISPEYNNKQIYCGSETETLKNNKWIKNKFKIIENSNYSSDLQKMLEKHENEKLLNCGIFGGNSELVKLFLNRISEIFTKITFKDDDKYNINMGIFNLIMREFNYVTGFPIHNRFRGNDHNSNVWFNHK